MARALHEANLTIREDEYAETLAAAKLSLHEAQGAAGSSAWADTTFEWGVRSGWSAANRPMPIGDVDYLIPSGG